MISSNEKYKMMLETLNYYAPDLVYTAGDIKQKVDEIINRYIKEWQEQNVTIDFSNEQKFLLPIINEYRAEMQQIIESQNENNKTYKNGFINIILIISIVFSCITIGLSLYIINL